MKFWLSIIISCALLVFGASAHAAQSAPVKSGRVTAQFVTDYDIAAPGQDLYIALSLRLEPKWHTYWRNPGGPGTPAAIHWQLPDGASVGSMTWPLPKIVYTGPIVNYAFEDRLLLPMPLSIPANAKPGDVLTLSGEAAYLVCHEVCLPESAQLELNLTIGEKRLDNRWSANITRALDTAPKPSDTPAAASLINGKLRLSVLGQYQNPYFFPYEQDLINADDPQDVTTGAHGIALGITPGFLLNEGLSGPVSGVLAFGPDGARKGIEITTSPNTTLDIGAKTSRTSGGVGLWAALIGAFIGGLILNLMPCVFPVLSIKVLGFTRSAHNDRSHIRREGWLYALGVVISFLALAGLLIALKSSGAVLGWGFQLQHPVMIASLAIIFVLIALNLFGMFEFGGRLQNVGAGLTQNKNGWSAFWTGVLAVVVASPCTAPFMAGAMGFAFTQPAFVTLLVFLALAIGFAAPFVLLAHAPGLLAKLPKPGAWMETFKQFMAFPMLATSIWLFWVLAGLSGADGVAAGLMAALLLAFAIWAWRHKTLGKVAALVALLSSLLLIGGLRTAEPTDITENAWSAQAVRTAQAQGKTVFVDFTADWCVTCKVNETLVLNRKAARRLFEEYNTDILIADWTRKDDIIAAELERHGRSGVPLYLVYSPDSNTPEVLPQTLSTQIIKAALERAKG